MPVVRHDLAVVLVGEAVLVGGRQRVPRASRRISLRDSEAVPHPQLDAVRPSQPHRVS
jgi:hypothetical protein